MNINKQLKEKIQDIVKVFPWYGELLGNEKRNYIIDDLPYITPDILEKFYYNKLDDATYSVYLTSGTSSLKRRTVYYSQNDDKKYIKIKQKIFEDFLRDSKIETVLSDMGTGHAASTAEKVFYQMNLKNESISFDLPITYHVSKLTKLKPQLLYTMPSILDSIINYSGNVLDFGIKKIILVGEIASRQWIKNIAEIFNICENDILDTYGSIELGTMAYYSHKCKCYLLAEGIYGEGIKPEKIDKSLDELESDEVILVLTSFVREVFPAVRFVTYDVVRGFHTLEIDGKLYQAFDSIVKRVGKEIKHGEKISIYDIENAVYKYIKKAQVRVNVENNRLSVFVDSCELNERIICEIEHEIQYAIPEIGKMINNNILEKIQVIPKSINQNSKNTIKNKKLYYGGDE